MFFLEAKEKIAQSPLSGELQNGDVIVGAQSEGQNGQKPKRRNKKNKKKYN